MLLMTTSKHHHQVTDKPTNGPMLDDVLYKDGCILWQMMKIIIMLYQNGHRTGEE